MKGRIAGRIAVKTGTGRETRPAASVNAPGERGQTGRLVAATAAVTTTTTTTAAATTTTVTTPTAAATAAATTALFTRTGLVDGSARPSSSLPFNAAMAARAS